MMLTACATEQAAVVERLDDLTAVTITHARTPIVMSPDTPFDAGAARDYAQIGVIEVNRMGSLQYFIWLGISEIEYPESVSQHPDGYESIILILDGDEFPLELGGWTHPAIGASQAVYRKLFNSSVDAYYEVELELIQLMSDAESVEFLTTGPSPKKFVSWYRQEKAKDELAEFVRIAQQ